MEHAQFVMCRYTAKKIIFCIFLAVHFVSMKVQLKCRDLSIPSSKGCGFFVCFTNSIRLCSLYVSIARLRQDPVEPFFQEGEHPPDIFILESKEPWEVPAQQDREQLSESQLRN